MLFQLLNVYPEIMRAWTRLLPLFLLALSPLPGSVITDALKTEPTRSMEHLKKQPTPPYFLSYELLETESVGVSGSFGVLVSSTPVFRHRQLGIDLRVGSYQLDNTHPIRGAMPNFLDNFSAFPMPIEDDHPDALRAMLWYYTDQKYKRSVEQRQGKGGRDR
jgi:TldD protein